jgi:hypothetical protein
MQYTPGEIYLRSNYPGRGSGSTLYYCLADGSLVPIASTMLARSQVKRLNLNERKLSLQAAELDGIKGVEEYVKRVLRELEEELL